MIGFIPEKGTYSYMPCSGGGTIGESSGSLNLLCVVLHNLDYVKFCTGSIEEADTVWVNRVRLRFIINYNLCSVATALNLYAIYSTSASLRSICMHLKKSIGKNIQISEVS